jgi:hypothetical protein
VRWTSDIESMNDIINAERVYFGTLVKECFRCIGVWREVCQYESDNWFAVGGMDSNDLG